MPTDPTSPPPAAASTPDGVGEKHRLTPAAERALAEAAARRAERGRNAGADGSKQSTPKEKDGRGGLDPTRYGDWEVNGLTSDF